MQTKLQHTMLHFVLLLEVAIPTTFARRLGTGLRIVFKTRKVNPKQSIFKLVSKRVKLPKDPRTRNINHL